MLAVALVGCTSSSTATHRGPVIRSTPGAWGVEARDVKATLESGRLRLVVAERECATSTTEYATVETTTTTTKVPWGTALGAVLGAGGAGLFIYGLTIEEPAAGEPQPFMSQLTALLIGGVAAGLGVGLLSFSPEYENTSTSDRQIPPGEREQARECRDTTGVVPGPLPWRIELGGLAREGQSPGSGEVLVAPVVLELLREAASRPAGLRGVVRSSSIPFTARLGDPGPMSGAISTRELPDSFFAEQSARYETTLSGDDLTRWSNCKLIAQSARERFECYWSQ